MTHFCIDIPANVRIAYKIFPNEEFSLDWARNGQTNSDWSALYGQFTLPHTIAYLPNHFDRGSSSASLVAITTKRIVRCYVFLDQLYANASVSSEVKAQLLRDCLGTHITTGSLVPGKPLLQSIGEDLNMFVAILDAVDVECAIPHCMMNHDNFAYTTIATFAIGGGGALVSNAHVVNHENCEKVLVPLSKAERTDVTLLSLRIELETGSKSCTWLDFADKSK